MKLGKKSQIGMCHHTCNWKYYESIIISSRKHNRDPKLKELLERIKHLISNFKNALYYIHKTLFMNTVS